MALAGISHSGQPQALSQAPDRSPVKEAEAYASPSAEAAAVAVAQVVMAQAVEAKAQATVAFSTAVPLQVQSTALVFSKVGSQERRMKWPAD